MDWHGRLLDLVRELQPARLCTLDPAARSLAERLLPADRLHAFDGPNTTPCTLALGIDALRGLGEREALELLGQARLFAAPAILIAAQPGCALDANAFRALGFIAEFADQKSGVTVYRYDIATYKPVPDWLNAKYWAHPERWEP